MLASKKLLKVFLFMVMIPILISCSASDEKSNAPTENSQAIHVKDHANRDVVLDEVPKRIVSLVVGDMEIVHALGGNIVGRPNVDKDTISNELVDVKEIGNSHDINYEMLVSLKPDLVIGHAGLNAKDVSNIESFGISVILTNSKSYDDILETIDMYGEVLEKQNEAVALIQSLEDERDEILASPLEKPVNALIIYGTTDTLMAALPNSLTGSLLELAGGSNIASQFPSIDSYPDYAQLPLERIIKANPDVIYFLTHGDTDAVKKRFQAELDSNKAWENVNAIKNENLVFLPPELFSTNPGPRIGEALKFMKESLVEVEQE